MTDCPKNGDAAIAGPATYGHALGDMVRENRALVKRDNGMGGSKWRITLFHWVNTGKLILFPVSLLPPKAAYRSV